MTHVTRVIVHMDFIIHDADSDGKLATDVEDFLRNSGELGSDAYLTFTNIDIVEEDVTNEIDPKEIIPQLPPMTVDNRDPTKGEPTLEITFHEPIPYFGHDPIIDRVNELLSNYIRDHHTNHPFELDWRDSMTCWVHLQK